MRKSSSFSSVSMVIGTISIISILITFLSLGLYMSINTTSSVAGLYTSVIGNVIDVVPSTLIINVATAVGLLGGQPVSPGETINLSLASAQSFNMLNVADSTMLGMNTSCLRPLLPSCYDISNQGCITPLLSSCIPQDLTLNSLMVNSLTIINATQLDISIGNQTAIYTEELFVTTGAHLSGPLTCTNNASIDNSCLNLGGYTCPLGTPLAESCIPASLIFTDASVTNMLTLNQVTCSGGPIPNSCLSSIIAPATHSYATVTYGADGRITAASSGVVPGTERIALTFLPATTTWTLTSPVGQIPWQQANIVGTSLSYSSPEVTIETSGIYMVTLVISMDSVGPSQFMVNNDYGGGPYFMRAVQYATATLTYTTQLDAGTVITADAHGMGTIVRTWLSGTATSYMEIVRLA